MKVMTVVGTRPEIIRLSALMKRLDAMDGIEHVLVHTGQNWDHRLNGIFFEEMGLRAPDHVLGVDVSSLGSTLGDTLRMTEAVLTSEAPDAFLVLGDTNSSISLLMAKRMEVPTYHMEAGNRCFDANVPEETNRRMVDHIADFNLAYTEHARRNLIHEGLPARRVFVTGSPMNEVLRLYAGDIARSTVHEDLGIEPEEYFVVSAHRQENVDDPSRLAALLECLNAVAERWGKPVLVSTHPRTGARLAAASGSEPHTLVRFHQPFGFFDYVRLQQDARCVLSDSGTISEESTILGFPAVTLRSSIERPEALDTGSITMTDLDPRMVLAGIEFATARPSGSSVPLDYQITNTSERVANVILSTARQHRFWSGLR